MGCEFQVGDEATLAEPGEGELSEFGIRYGEVYTVSGVLPPLQSEGVCGLRFEGINAGTNPRVGFAHTEFRKVQKRNDRLTIEAFSVIKDGFEEPKRAPEKTPAKEKA